MKHSILVVEDEVDNVDALERLFRKSYHVHKATGGKEALQILKKEPVSLIISDQRMPQMTGVEFLSKSMDLRPDAIRILLTGYTDVESIIDAINSGQIYKYVTKPWDPVDLTNTVAKAIQKFELREELKVKNAALEKALAELKTLDEAKNQFMILINHELKTPLTVILSYLQLLEDTQLTEDQDKFLARIQAAALRLQALINDSLELVSAETRQIKIKPKKLEIASLVKGVQEQFLEDAKGKGLKFKLELGKQVLNADEQVVRSVLRRLLDNAVKFGQEGTDIVVAAEALDEQRISLSVTNHGKALSPGAIEKILKPFTLDENVMNHTKGSGLGLSICRALLEAHDSQLEIACPKGQFRAHFVLPSA